VLFPKIMQLLRERGAENIVVFAGGIIPEEDMAPLRQAGIAAIFTPGTSLQQIVDWVRAHVRPPGVTA